MKTCRKCGESKPLEDFYAMAGMRDGHRNECKACNLRAKAERHRRNPEPARVRAKQWARDNPERVAARTQKYRDDGRRRINDPRYHLKKTFGLTVDQYDEMLRAQGGGCAICGRLPRPDIALHVDHDHETGIVRGLTCFRCNNALGDFNDDPALLARASDYLDRHDPEVRELKSIVRARARALVGAGPSTLF